MKGLVILMLVVLAVLVDQAASKHVFKYPSVAPWMDISTLLSKLGDPMPGQARDGAKEVFERLFETLDKHKMDSRLKEYTVGQLVALNEWSVDDCEDNKLKERRSICDKFYDRDLTNLVRAPKRKTEDGDLMTSSNDQIHLNVGKFCWKIIEFMERLCPAMRVQALREDKVVEERFTSFGNQVSFGMFRLSQIIRPNFSKLVTKKLKELEEKDAEEAAALKENCSFIMNEYNKPGARFVTNLSFLTDINVCKEILKLNEIETRPKLDEVQLPASRSAKDGQA